MSSCRANAIMKLHDTLDISQAIFMTRVASGNSSGSNSDTNDAFQLNYLTASIELNHVLNSQYARRAKYRKSTIDVFQQDLDDSDGCWLTPDEFKHKYRMSRESLEFISERIKHHDIFRMQKNGGRQQAPVKHQLMVLLNYLGTDCSNDNRQRNVFFLGAGTSRLYRNRCVKALISIRDEYIKWPNPDERKEISTRIEKNFNIPNCVGIMDGTLLELGLKPSCNDASDYHGRKLPFSLTVLFICDDKRRIRYYLGGFPGSTHDNRVWRNSKVNKQPDDHFNDIEYIICDTAFEPSPYCIPAYKSDVGFVLTRGKELFNQILAKPRVISEHAIGISKGRFPFLRKIKMLLTNKQNSLKKILMYIDAAIILHNMLIDLNDTVQEEWDCDDDASDIDDASRIPEEDVLYTPLPYRAPMGWRREQLREFVCETLVFPHKFNFAPDNEESEYL